MPRRKGMQFVQLHMAAQVGDLDVVQTAIGHGQKHLSRFDELGKTPLHYAAEGEHFAVVKLLIQAGADVNAHDPRVIGNTPLGAIAGNCSLEMAELLVKAGADPTIRGWMQLCALDRAKVRKRENDGGVYELLRKAAKHLLADH